ncbi:MAG TPA: EthD family reductase [Baekduia sp.]|jgi:uncharacterized protein (TIGR02118 family)
MIRVSAMYPTTPGKTFDHDYYRDSHVPLALRLFGPHGLQRVEIDRGIEGPGPGQAPPYVAIGHLFFDSAEGFHAALAANGAEVLGDIPNFTQIDAQLQLSEIVS